MLELHNIRIKQSNVRKKNVRTTKCEKRTVTCDVRTVQCKDKTVIFEKKVRESLTVRKELLHMILQLHNVRMEPSNVRKM